MSSPAENKAYYDAAPQPPPKDASDKEMAEYQKKKASYEKTAGPPPAPAPVSPPSPPVPGAGLPQARISDMTAHGGAIIVGMPTVLVGMLPAARITDMHVCPMVTVVVPHVGGPIIPPTSMTVLIGMLPAARMTDRATCVGPPDVIAMGCFTVLVG